jgi:hypothetical protein
MKRYIIKSEVITPVNIKDAVFWDVRQRSLVYSYQRHGGTHCIHLQCRRANRGGKKHTDVEKGRTGRRLLTNHCNLWPWKCLCSKGKRAQEEGRWVSIYQHTRRHYIKSWFLTNTMFKYNNLDFVNRYTFLKTTKFRNSVLFPSSDEKCRKQKKKNCSLGTLGIASCPVQCLYLSA